MTAVAAGCRPTFRPRTWAEFRRALALIRRLGGTARVHRPCGPDTPPAPPVEPQEPAGDGWPLEPLEAADG